MVHKEGGKAVSNIKQTKLMKNETLHTMLLRINFDIDNIIKIISSIQKLPNSKDILKALPTGMRVSYSNNSKIIGGALKLRYNKTKDLFIWQNYDYSYNARIVLRPTKFEKTYATGSIKSSFYKSAIEAGIPENTLFEMVKLLGFSVDFQRDIREGDTFEVLFSKQIDVLDDKVIDTMPMRFLSITLSGKKETFFEFKDKDGYTRYYDEQGKSSIRTLMKTPINGARLSSRYGNRKHPILGYNKMHRGVDFSAPVGTPIFASGDGIIEIEPLNGPIGQKVKVAQLATTYGSEVPLAKTIDGFVRPIDGSIPAPDNRTVLLSGFLEGSNVKSVDELVSGIDQSRAYEINVKFVTTAKEIDEATASLMRMPQ